MTGYREYRNRQEMLDRGWKIASKDSECNRCGAAITWSESPHGKKVPLDVNSVQLHFKSCSNGGAPSSSPPQTSSSSPSKPSSPAEPLRNHGQPQGNESIMLREALDECAQAVRELCRILRARAEAAK